MTTILTRVFTDSDAAETAQRRMGFKGLPQGSSQIITAGPKAAAEMTRARVHESAMAAYAKQLDAGKALLVVKAGYKPLGAARMAREVLGRMDTIGTGKVLDDYRLPWEPDHAPSVLKDHPQFFSVPGLQPPGRISEAFGMPLLKTKPRGRSVSRSGRPASRLFWPMPLLKKKRKATSAIRGGRHMSRAFWPMKLISSGPRRRSVIPGGGFPLSRRLGWKLLS